MTKREAEKLARQIRQEQPDADVSPSSYGRGAWTVCVVKQGIETEYRNPEEWRQRKPARSRPLSEVPQLDTYPVAGLNLDVDRPAHLTLKKS